MEELLADMFAAGAYSTALDAGMEKDSADRFVSLVCKEAAASRVMYDEDEDDEEGTWWSRNKKWALPTSIGLAAFLAGADAGRNGRPDRSHFSNALGLFYNRLKALFGFPSDPMYNISSRAAPRTDWRKYEIGRINNENDIKGLEDYLERDNDPAKALNPNKHPESAEVHPNYDRLKNITLRPFTESSEKLLDGYLKPSPIDGYKRDEGYNPITWAR